MTSSGPRGVDKIRVLQGLVGLLAVVFVALCAWLYRMSSEPASAAPRPVSDSPAPVGLDEGAAAAAPADAPVKGCKGIVAMDTGHTPAAPGSISARGVTEYVLNQRLSRTVEQALREAGTTVVMLSSTGLGARVTEAQRAGADLLLSIHHDSVQERYLEPWTHQGVLRDHTTYASGYSVFVSGRSPRFEDAQRVARRLGKRLADAGLNPTLHHAEPIRGEGRTLVDAASGLYQFDELIVLQSPMPSVLLEAGVIKNASDEALVNTDAYRDAFARAVVRALGESCGRWGQRPDPG